MNDEEFLAWLEKQPDIQMPKHVYVRAMNLLENRNDTYDGIFKVHLPQPPFVCAQLIRERMVERVAKRIE